MTVGVRIVREHCARWRGLSPIAPHTHARARAPRASLPSRHAAPTRAQSRRAPRRRWCCSAIPAPRRCGAPDWLAERWRAAAPYPDAGDRALVPLERALALRALPPVHADGPVFGAAHDARAVEVDGRHGCRVVCGAARDAGEGEGAGHGSGGSGGHRSPFRVPIRSPVAMFHRRILQSYAPDTTRCSSNLTQLTRSAAPVTLATTQRRTPSSAHQSGPAAQTWVPCADAPAPRARCCD
jgi:hypothetical protein